MLYISDVEMARFMEYEQKHAKLFDRDRLINLENRRLWKADLAATFERDRLINSKVRRAWKSDVAATYASDASRVIPDSPIYHAHH